MSGRPLRRRSVKRRWTSRTRPAGRPVPRRYELDAIRCFDIGLRVGRREADRLRYWIDRMVDAIDTGTTAGLYQDMQAQALADDVETWLQDGDQ